MAEWAYEQPVFPSYILPGRKGRDPYQFPSVSDKLKSLSEVPEGNKGKLNLLPDKQHVSSGLPDEEG